MTLIGRYDSYSICCRFSIEYVDNMFNSFFNYSGNSCGVNKIRIQRCPFPVYCDTQLVFSISFLFLLTPNMYESESGHL